MLKRRALLVLVLLALVFEVAAQSRDIPGLAPVDVYLNHEKIGFKTSKSFSSSGNLWECKLVDGGVEYITTAYSMKATTVETVRATARLIDLSKSIQVTKQYFKYVGSLPYSGANPARVAAWIDSNFNTDKATIEIGGVRFTMFCPSAWVRMMNIEKKLP